MGTRLVRKGWFWLAVLVAGLLVANIVWIRLDESPPLWDIAGHSSRAAQTAELLRGFHLKSVFTIPGQYPPATHLLTAKAFLVFGMHPDVPQYSLLFFLAIFCAGVYRIGIRLFRQSLPALVATLVASSYPLLAHFSRIYDLDFPLTAWTVVSVALLLETERFTKRGFSIAFAIAVAIGCLTKWTFVFFLIGPFVLEAWWSWKERRAWMNVLLALCVTAILALPWYALHFSEISRAAVATRNNVFSVPYENLFSFGSVSYYAVKTAKAISWPLAALAAVGILFAFVRRSHERTLLLLWIVAPYAIMTIFFFSKESRYYLPAYPALALLSVSAFLGLRRQWKTVGLSILAVSSVWVWMETSWHVRFLPHDWYFKMNIYANLYGYFEPSSERVGFGFPYPTRHHTVVSQVADAIRFDALSRGKTENDTRVAVVPNSIFLTAQQIQYYNLLHGFKPDYGLSSRVRQKNEQHRLIEADYVVTKTGEQGPSVWRGDLDELDPTLLDYFTLLQTWPLDGIESEPQEARLYRRNP